MKNTISNDKTIDMLFDVAGLSKDLTVQEVQDIRIVKSDGTIVGRVRDLTKHIDNAQKEFGVAMLEQPTAIKGNKIFGTSYEILIDKKIIIIR